MRSGNSTVVLLLIVLSFLCGCKSRTPSLHLYVSNLSRLHKEIDVNVFFDNKSIFDSTVVFSADEPYREYVTDRKFTQGNHTILVTADSGNLKMTQPVSTKEDMWVFVTYTQGSPADKVLDSSSVKKIPSLAAVDLDKSNPSLHIFISGAKPRFDKPDRVYKKWATDTSSISQ